MASDPMSVSGSTLPIQSTGALSTHAHPSPEARPNGPLPTNGRVEAQQGPLRGAANRTDSNQFGRINDTSGDPSQGVAATDKEMVEKLTDAVEKINEILEQGRQMLTFQLDEESGRMVIRVIDAQTNEVIRQIPSEETLNFAKYVDGLVGLIFNKKA